MSRKVALLVVFVVVLFTALSISKVMWIEDFTNTCSQSPNLCDVQISLEMVYGTQPTIVVQSDSHWFWRVEIPVDFDYYWQNGLTPSQAARIHEFMDSYVPPARDFHVSAQMLENLGWTVEFWQAEEGPEALVLLDEMGGFHIMGTNFEHAPFGDLRMPEMMWRDIEYFVQEYVYR